MEQYEEVKRLGAGAFGVASLVRRLSDGKFVVSKRMRLCGMTDKERDDALNEARCLSKIQHAFVTHYHESVYDKDFLYIIMEYAPNGDLGARLKKQRVPAGGRPTPFADELIMRWVLQVRLRVHLIVENKRDRRLTLDQLTTLQLLLALDFIHEECRILHRDLKPQNIFLTSKNKVRLGDFGISKVLSNTLSVASTCVGTPLYLAL